MPISKKLQVTQPQGAVLEALRGVLRLSEGLLESEFVMDMEMVATRQPWARPLVFGLLGAVGLLTFYLGTITLAQGWGHALQQLAEDRWFIGAIAAGFGTQIGLFTYLRTLHLTTSMKGMSASTGTSTAAMLACCAHHLAEVLPILGLSGAAIFLNSYKVPLLWLGIGMNVLAIGYFLRQILSQPRAASSPSCHTA